MKLECRHKSHMGLVSIVSYSHAFNQEKALVGAFSVIVTCAGTFG